MKPLARVVVGSTNEVKVNSVRLAFKPYYDAKVVGVEVESGVGAQPLGEETFLGARRRAANAMKKQACDFAVGIEGGIMDISSRSQPSASSTVKACSLRPPRASSLCRKKS